MNKYKNFREVHKISDDQVWYQIHHNTTPIVTVVLVPGDLVVVIHEVRLGIDEDTETILNFFRYIKYLYNYWSQVPAEDFHKVLEIPVIVGSREFFPVFWDLHNKACIYVLEREDQAYDLNDGEEDEESEYYDSLYRGYERDRG